MKKTPTIFIIDDDLSARRGISRLLHTAGYETLAYASADEFIATASPETKSGCIILDARMPGLSGEDLKKELIARNIDLPFLVISADDEPNIRKKAQSLEAKGFFRKPVDGIALLDAIAWTIKPPKNSLLSGY